MSHGGTRAHLTATDLPPLVRAAAESAAALGFEQSCRPEHGRLLALLAGGVGAGLIGATGTGGGARRGRLHWLRHPRLLATELPLTPTAATIVGRRLPG